MWSKIKQFFNLSQKNRTLQKQVEELEKQVKNLQDSKNVQSRIPRDVYDEFKKGLPNLHLTDTSSTEVACQKLGVALVLSKMEKDLVI